MCCDVRMLRGGEGIGGAMGVANKGVGRGVFTADGWK